MANVYGEKINEDIVFAFIATNSIHDIAIL